MENNREFKVLTDVEHVLLRPNMYIGGINLIEKEQWVYDRDAERFKYGTIKYVPAVVKCASELIDNSLDVAIDTNFEKATKIQVNVDDKSIEVVDNGIGIPCEPPKNNPTEKRTCAELAWTTLKSGTSFGENRKKLGVNGVGSSCVNVFSSLFVGESDDGRHRQVITCRNNLSEIKAGKICKSSGKAGVRVYCEPDLKRFGMERIDNVHMDLIYQRIVNLAISYPKVRFSFNGKAVKVGVRGMSQMFSDDCITEAGRNFAVCVFPNESDEFRYYTYVNGLDLRKGGTHVDYISFEIASRVRDRLVRKYKNIKPADIKNKMSLVVFFTDFANPEFDSQTKECLSNSQGDITRHLDGRLDFDKLAKAVLKNEAIVGPIVDMFKLKEELKARKELKAAKKVKVRSEKYMSPIGEHKYLALVEGNSAASGLQSSIGRNGIGFFACRGLPVNAYSSSIQKIVQNEEFKLITSILGLDTSAGKDVAKTISFDKILIATDADADGAHLTSMFLGWFKRFGENLFAEGKICRLNIPLVLVVDKNEKVVEHFFNLTEFKKWEGANPRHKYRIEYWKGLGSTSKVLLNQLIEKFGFEYFIQTYRLDEKGSEYLDHWLNNDMVEKRKEYLKSYQLDINNI